MAISPEYPGLEVKIFFRGQQLHEYDDEDPVPKTTTKYIEARSDSKFVVATTFRPPFSTRYHVRAHLSIDGVSMTKWFSDREDLFQKPFQTSGLRWQQDGEWVKQEFCFAKLNIGKYQGCCLLSYADGVAQSKRHVDLPPVLLL